MFSKLVFILGGGFVVLLSVLFVFHLGPPWITSGEDRIMSSTSLTNGSKLFLVLHRTESLIDAYEVSLFRVDPATNVFISWLGYEDGYWWRGELVSDPPGDEVKVNVLGTTIATYSTSKDSTIWHGRKTKIIPSRKIDGVNITDPIPKAILE